MGSTLSYVSKSEMKEILSDSELVKNLETGIEDIFCSTIDRI